jgi:hypothetical protein
MNIPQDLIYPLPEFAWQFAAICEIGMRLWPESSVAFVGLARNCAVRLDANLARLEVLTSSCRQWKLHIVTNDNDDETPQVLEAFSSKHPQATFTDTRLGRQQYTSEFAGRRTEALAEYRTACQSWVRENAVTSDLVVIIDFDSWGGWSHDGLLHGVGSLATTPDAYGIASVSLAEYPQLGMGEDQKPVVRPGWVHYDAWALRLNSYRDDYTAGDGGWKHQWIPPVGSPVVPVCSAFGGMAIYETAAYLAGTYSGEDCEHVPFHRTIAEATGGKLYLDPSMRTVMSWMEPDNGGKHSDDLPADVSH